MVTQGNWINTIGFLFISLIVYSQKRIFIENDGKKHIMYTSLEEANEVNPDSVIYLELRSKGLKDFPVEVIRFKNLEVLDLMTLSYLDVPYLLNEKQKKQLESAKKKCNCSEPNTNEYKTNHIKTVPQELDQLKKLRYISLSGVHFNYKLLDDFTRIIPNTIVEPSKELIKISKKEEKEYMKHLGFWKKLRFKYKRKYY